MTLRISEIAVQMKVGAQDPLSDWPPPSAGAGGSYPGGSGSNLSGLGVSGPGGSISPKEMETLVERCTAQVLSRIRIAGER